MRFTLNSISVFLLGIFLFCICIDPTGVIFHAKEMLFVILMFLTILNRHIIKQIPSDVLFIVLFCLSVPMYGICVAICKNAFVDTEYAFGQYKSLMFILFVFLLIEINFNKTLKVVYIIGSLIAIFTVIIYLLGQTGLHDIFTLVYQNSIENSNIIISRRTFVGVSLLGVYFKAGPLILFSYIYSLYFAKYSRSNLFWRIVNLFALLVAGSRMPTLIGLLITGVYCFDKMKSYPRFRLCLSFMVGIAFLILVILLATEKEESNNIKSENFTSYIDNFFEGTNSILGAGLGSVFYAEGRDRYVSNSEFSYFDIIRMYGGIIGLLFSFLVFYPSFYFYHSKYCDQLKYSRFAMAYILYMILAGTNPLLLSSTGMFVWSMGLASVYHIKNNSL